MDTIDAALDRARQRRRTIDRLPAPRVCQAIRERADVSQQDIATALKVTRECIAMWERGKRRPRGERAAQYVKILERLQAATLAAS
jgi:DNA-binding transcriptional regulator YiaG